jgi:hypothetical protein
MGKAISAQHPAVVLRSHYRQLRALLAIAMIAVVGLSAALVILATNDDGSTGASVASHVGGPAQVASAPRTDGGPEESALAAAVGSQPSALGPNESKIAATIGSGPEPSVSNHPDETSVAAAISGH